MSRASVTALFGVSSFEQAYYALRTRGSTLSPVFSAVRGGGASPTTTTFENLSSSGFNTVRDVNANTVTFNLNTCPNWTVGKTGKPLYQETAANRVSQQIALSGQFQRHIQFVISQTTPMTGAEYMVTPSPSFPGAYAFTGGVLMLDGRVFCVPTTNTVAFIYDPVKDTVTTPAGTYPVPGSGGAYEGGVLLPDGRVACIPSNNYPVRIYNPANDSLFVSTATWPGSQDNIGGVLMHDGRIFVPAYNGTYAIIYDPVQDIITTAAAGTTWPGGAGFKGGTLLLDGRIYCQPRSTSRARIYNPFTNTITTPGGTFTGTYQGTNACLMADGRVYLPPYGFPGPSFARIYNPDTDTLSTAGGTFPTSRAVQGCKLLPDGRIYCAPDSPDFAFIYDPITDTLITPAGTNPSAALSKYEGCVVLFSGDVFLVPANTTSGRIHKLYENANFSPALLTGPYYNKYQ